MIVLHISSCNKMGWMQPSKSCKSNLFCKYLYRYCSIIIPDHLNILMEFFLSLQQKKTCRLHTYISNFYPKLTPISLFCLTVRQSVLSSQLCWWEGNFPDSWVIPLKWWRKERRILPVREQRQGTGKKQVPLSGRHTWNHRVILVGSVQYVTPR